MFSNLEFTTLKISISLTKYLIIVFIIIISSFACFYKLGEPEFVRWDEYTNYGVVMDTIKAERFFVLKYENSQTNNQTGYFFEKPPLWYWLTGIVVRIGGDSNFNFRIISALSGIGVLLSIFWLGRSIAGFKAGIISWLVAILTPHFFVSFNEEIFSTHTFKSADLDALQLFFILLSLNFFLNNSRTQRSGDLGSQINTKTQIPALIKLGREYKSIILASLFSALAYMTKGPLGFLPGILFFSFMGIQLLKKQIAWKTFLKLLGIYGGIMILLAGSWFVYMTYLFGWDFINEYFIYHTVKRVATPLEGHGGNWFTYIHYLFNKQLFLFAEIGTISFIFLILKFKLKIFNDFRFYFPIAGAVIVFIFLTLTQTKIAWYLFYLYPLVCLIIGLGFSELLKTKLNKKLNGKDL